MLGVCIIVVILLVIYFVYFRGRQEIRVAFLMYHKIFQMRGQENDNNTELLEKMENSFFNYCRKNKIDSNLIAKLYFKKRFYVSKGP